MKRALAFGLLFGSLGSLGPLGCGGSQRAQSDGAPSSSDADAGDVSSDRSGDPSLCGCSVDSTGTLSLSWDCYCAQSFAACDTALAVPAICGTRARKDYPSCGLTVVIDFTGAGVEVPSVYDSSGKLVGRVAHSDLSGYLCPSDPSIASVTERAGQFPDATCQAVICDGCYAGPFPCGRPDGGGASDAASDTDTKIADDR